MPFLTFFLLLFLFPPTQSTCPLILPTPPLPPPPSPLPTLPSPSPSPPLSRVLSGLKPPPESFDNIVVLLDPTDETHCSGSLLSPHWVLTSAQCLATPQWTALIRPVTTDPENGRKLSIATAIPHPSWGLASGPIIRDDLMLIKLATPAFEIPTSPSPGLEEPSEQRIAFNVMRINSNPQFAVNATGWLRVKGFGIRERGEVLTGAVRELKIADLELGKCNRKGGNDAGRRVCTLANEQCGPCWGDTGGPLYDVDKSGTVAVLIGVVTFGISGIAFADADNVCTAADTPVVYTAVAMYLDWIRSVVGEGGLVEQFVPVEGIGDVDLNPEVGLSVAARVSIIVVACLCLLAAIVAICVIWGGRIVRKRRKRWAEGLAAEESFVNGWEKDNDIVDPFEGIVDDHKSPRLSINSLSRGVVKSATEFSAKSLGAIRALLKQMDEEENMTMETREVIEDAPQWLPGAWQQLFRPPSKSELSSIHKIPTQRVVDDVLEGGDKSVEPSLDDVAFKNARDEENMKLAWKKLEIQTSMRNLSAVGSSADGQPLSPSPTLPSASHNSSLGLSNPLSRGPGRAGGSIGGRPFSGLLGSLESKQPDISRADMLLAAFASIDAESEHVVEETVIDSSALRALAMAKRPNVLSALRKKFSSGAGNNAQNVEVSGSYRNAEDEGDQSRRRGPSNGNGKGRAVSGGATEGTSPHVHTTRDHGEYVAQSSAGALPSVGVASVSGAAPSSAMPHASSSGLGNGDGVSGKFACSISTGALPPQSARQNSMGMDYFSEDYSLSDSDAGAESPVIFEDYMTGRRYTEDRPALPGSVTSNVSLKKGQSRSFEKLERRGSRSDSESGSDAENEDEAGGYEAGDDIVSTREVVDVKTVQEKRPRQEQSRSAGEEDEASGSGFDANIFSERITVEAEGLNERDERFVIESGSDSGADSVVESGSRSLFEVDSDSQISVEMLRSMWNELARRESEDKQQSQ